MSKIDLPPLIDLYACEQASRRVTEAELRNELPRSKARRLHSAINDRITALRKTGREARNERDDWADEAWSDDERRLFEALVDGDTAAYERIQRERCEKALTALEQGDREPAKTLLTEYAEKHAMIADVA